LLCDLDDHILKDIGLNQRRNRIRSLQTVLAALMTTRTPYAIKQEIPVRKLMLLAAVMTLIWWGAAGATRFLIAGTPNGGAPPPFPLTKSTGRWT
jgi:hypothetical protein